MNRKERVRRINAAARGEIDNKPKEDYMDSLLAKPLQQNDQGYNGSSGLSRKSRVRQVQYEGLINSATNINTTPMYVYMVIVFCFLVAVFVLYMLFD